METTDSQFDGSIESAVNGLLSPELQDSEPEEQELEGDEIGEAEEVVEGELDTDEVEEAEEDERDTEEAEEPEPELYTVRVDGKEEKVTLEELTRGYSGQQYVHKGMQEAAAYRKEAEAVYASF